MFSWIFAFLVLSMAFCFTYGVSLMKKSYFEIKDKSPTLHKEILGERDKCWIDTNWIPFNKEERTKDREVQVKLFKLLYRGVASSVVGSKRCKRFKLCFHAYIVSCGLFLALCSLPIISFFIKVDLVSTW